MITYAWSACRQSDTVCLYPWRSLMILSTSRLSNGHSSWRSLSLLLSPVLFRGRNLSSRRVNCPKQSSNNCAMDGEESNFPFFWELPFRIDCRICFRLSVSLRRRMMSFSALLTAVIYLWQDEMTLVDKSMMLAMLATVPTSSMLKVEMNQKVAMREVRHNHCWLAKHDSKIAPHSRVFYTNILSYLIMSMIVFTLRHCETYGTLQVKLDTELRYHLRLHSSHSIHCIPIPLRQNESP